MASSPPAHDGVNRSDNDSIGLQWGRGLARLPGLDRGRPGECRRPKAAAVGMGLARSFNVVGYGQGRSGFGPGTMDLPKSPFGGKTQTGSFLALEQTHGRSLYAKPLPVHQPKARFRLT